MDKGSTISRFFSRYRDVILFNKNLIISGTCGFLASAYVSQLYSQYYINDFIDSVTALAAEYGVYIPLFAALFYIDNRQRYIDPSTGVKDTNRIRQDIKKLFAAFSISEVVFSITRILSQYYLLQLGTEPYEASMISSLLSWGIFFVAVNSLVKIVRLFKKT